MWSRKASTLPLITFKETLTPVMNTNVFLTDRCEWSSLGLVASLTDPPPKEDLKICRERGLSRSKFYCRKNLADRVEPYPY